MKTNELINALNHMKVQKLGAIEHLAPKLLKNTCIGVCLHSPEDDREHDEVCRGCPVYELTMLVEGIQND